MWTRVKHEENGDRQREDVHYGNLALEEMTVVAIWNKTETTQRDRLLFSRASNPCATNARLVFKDDLGAREATEISRNAYPTETSGGTEMLFNHS